MNARVSCNNLANALRLRFELHFGERPEPELPAEDIDIDISDLNAAIKLYAAALSEPASDPAQVERAMILRTSVTCSSTGPTSTSSTDEPDKAAAVLPPGPGRS